MLLLALMSVGIGAAVAMPSSDATLANPLVKRCYNAEDAQKDAHRKGCFPNSDLDEIYAYCNFVGCNCDGGCIEPTRKAIMGDITGPLAEHEYKLGSAFCWEPGTPDPRGGN